MTLLLMRLMGNCLSSRRRIQNPLRVVRSTDGKVLEYRESILVKDLLMNNDGFFVALTQEAINSRRLPTDYELKTGKVYYLIPIGSLVDGDDEEGNIKGGIKRIKVVITKKQLQQLLSNRVSVEEVISDLRLQKGRFDDGVDEYSPRGWRPKLQTIQEASDE